MNPVRVHGNPFGDDLPASQLRSFLRLASASGLDCALALAAVRGRPPAPGETAVPLQDGVGTFVTGTRLPPAEIELVQRAAEHAVAASAPLVVFAAPAELPLTVQQAGLEWPEATAVLAAAPGVPAADLLLRVRAELRWAGVAKGGTVLRLAELQPWLALPPVAPAGVLVHFGGTHADGADLVAGLLPQLAGRGIERARVVVLPGTAAEEVVGPWSPAVEVVHGAPTAELVRDAAMIVLPWRQLRDPRVLLLALASGRPLVVSQWAATARILRQHGAYVPVGGRLQRDAGGAVTGFAPDERQLLAAVQEAVADRRIGGRARRWVLEHGVDGNPPSPPAAVAPIGRRRPVVVLEAPFCETSSSAELSLATARALQARGEVDLQLVATVPFQRGLQGLADRAPELLPHLVRQPRRADWWLSSGWPVRAARPDCRQWALRIDQEHGALPVALTPRVNEEADVVVVHSEYVRRLVAAAGTPEQRIVCIPHGVDEPMQPSAQPDAAILRWKGDLPAVLFCGGMIWRKGFDVFLRCVLGAAAAGARFAVVIKSVGHDQHYQRSHLGELVERCRRTPGTPPILVLDAELSRERLASVYTACDLLLHPYRGEGFCLPILEARACGLPVLATAGGAADPLLEGPGAVALAAHRRMVELPQPHVTAPWLLEPDAELGTSALLQALRGLPALRAAARGSAAGLRQRYTWSAAAERVEQLAVAAMRGVAAAPPLPVTLPVGPGPVREKFPVAIGHSRGWLPQRAGGEASVSRATGHRADAQGAGRKIP
jgi:glycosyltransferase involved in cell wall biosynthesis